MYTDTLGQRQTIERSIPFDSEFFFQQDATAGAARFGQRSQTPWYYYAIGIIVLAAAGWFAYKKFFKKKPVSK